MTTNKDSYDDCYVFLFLFFFMLSTNDYSRWTTLWIRTTNESTMKTTTKLTTTYVCLFIVYILLTTIHYSQKDYTTLMDMRTSDNYNGRWRWRQRWHHYKSGMFFFPTFFPFVLPMKHSRYLLTTSHLTATTWQDDKCQTANALNCKPEHCHTPDVKRAGGRRQRRQAGGDKEKRAMMTKAGARDINVSRAPGMFFFGLSLFIFY